MPNWSHQNPCANCGKKSGYPMIKCDTCGSLRCQSCQPGGKCRSCKKGNMAKI